MASRSHHHLQAICLCAGSLLSARRNKPGQTLAARAPTRLTAKGQSAAFAAGASAIICFIFRYTAFVHPNPISLDLYPIFTCTFAFPDTTLYFSRIVPSCANPSSTVASHFAASRRASSRKPAAFSPATPIQFVGAHPNGSSHCIPESKLLIDNPPGRSNRFSFATTFFASSLDATPAHKG